MADPSLPETMTAIEIREPGGPEVLQPTRRPVPRPGHGEVLVKVRAAGINRPDAMQRSGNYPPPPGAPDIPGLMPNIALQSSDGFSRRPGGSVMAA